MEKTKIEWTDTTWNPITGCTKISGGCLNCYAEVMAKRLQAMGIKKYENGFRLSFHESALQDPFHWKTPRKVFVNSMSDLFHEDVPFSFVDKIINVIHQTPQHQYQILTKRAERMNEYFTDKVIPENVWLGVTVENKVVRKRIDALRVLDAKIKFLSCEPLLEDLGDLNLAGIDWVIVGGESGSFARPMKEKWVINILNQSVEQNVAFFFKQWGTWGPDGIKRNKKANGSILKGEIYKEFPEVQFV